MRTPTAPGVEVICCAECSRSAAWGRFLLFVNLENAGDIRQTRYDPLVRPSRAADGRWTVDAWAPLDGRVINGGLRLTF